MTNSQSRFLDTYQYFDPKVDHHVEAVKQLYTRIPQDALDKYFKTYSPAPIHNPLKVAYESQNDNASGTGYRECFSSSCAMLARYYGKVNNDNEYNNIRARYGDTTSSEAQLRALRSLGLRADFHTNGKLSLIQHEIDSLRPVAVGWLHHGPSYAPSGGGHWSVIIGYDDNATIHNDPNGEADLANGGYLSNRNGASQRYSHKNWLPRWEVEGLGTGWFLTCGPEIF